LLEPATSAELFEKAANPRALTTGQNDRPHIDWGT
jgi:hypothetical protein